MSVTSIPTIPATIVEDLSAQINALWDLNYLKALTGWPPDAQVWLESPFIQLQNSIFTVENDFFGWEQHMPLNYRCRIYKDVNFGQDFDGACSGLSLEAAALGGVSKLNYILTQRHPTLLPSLRSYLSRVQRTYNEAGSHEAMLKLAALSKMEITLTEEEKKIGHAVLAKSAGLMNSIIGPGTAESFLAGTELVFSGKHYSFAVSGKDHDHVINSFYTDPGPIPYHLDLRTLGGEPLAKGCIVFENTPVLDQVTGLYMHIKSGQERTILRQANWRQRTPLFREHVSVRDCPDLRNKIDRPRREAKPIHLTPPIISEARRIYPQIREILMRKMNIDDKLPFFKIDSSSGRSGPKLLSLKAVAALAAPH